MKRILGILALAGFCGLGGPALADRATILVLDESGSMWAQLAEGRSRIEVARDVLAEFLTGRDGQAPLGVIAYGHNRKGDCTDIEVIAPVGAQDGAALAGRLRDLMPKGKTPLADALRLAGQAIPLTAEEADIVLITDGLESCGGDPCAVAAELEQQGIPVRAHVVGFGLTEGEIAQIACVAEATGGQVLSAQSGEELALALNTVDLPPTEISLSLRPVDALMGDVLGYVDWVVTDSAGQEVARAEGAGTLPVDLMAGDYSVLAMAPGYTGSMALSVAADTAGVVDVLLDRTDAHVFLIAEDEETGAELAEASWVLRAEDGMEIAVEGGGQGYLLVPPGQYQITAMLDDRTATEERGFELGDYTVTLALAAPLLEATLDAPPEAVAGAQIEVSWTGPDDQNDFVTVLPDGAPDGDEGNLARTYHGNPASLKLPDATGAWELRYIHAPSGRVLARQPITLTEAGATLEAPDEAIAGARISVNWQGPDNQNDFVTVVEAGAPDEVEGNLARTYRGNPADLLLPDGLGAYELRYVLAQSGRVLARRPITLTEPSAALQDPGPILPGGRFKVVWEGPDNQNDFITIVPKGASETEEGPLARTYRGSPAEIKSPEAPGSYELRYVLAQSGRVLAVLPVEVGGGAVSLALDGAAKVGQPIRVNWTGPGRYEDFIEIVPVGAAADLKALRSARASQGNPATLSAPPSPGRYQLRYRASDSGEVLSEIEIEVTE